MSHLRLQERFRQEFLDQLPHKLQHAAQFLDALPHHASPQAPLAELFLIIHSIRGSSATFGLPWLTVICHPFEELIQSANDTRLQVSLFVTLAHNYLALLHHTAQTLAEGRSPGDDIPKQLAKLHRQAFALCFTVAVVVNSRTLREMCLQALQPLSAMEVRSTRRIVPDRRRARAAGRKGEGANGSEACEGRLQSASRHAVKPFVGAVAMGFPARKSVGQRPQGESGQ